MESEQRVSVVVSSNQLPGRYHAMCGCVVKRILKLCANFEIDEI